MGHNNQRLLQAGFRNKLVAKLKSLDIKVTKKKVGAKKRGGGLNRGSTVSTPLEQAMQTHSAFYLSQSIVKDGSSKELLRGT